MHSFSFGNVVFSRKTEWQQVCARALHSFVIAIHAHPIGLQVDVIETEAYGNVLMLDGA